MIETEVSATGVIAYDYDSTNPSSPTYNVDDVNQAAIVDNLTNRLTTIETWLAANPNTLPTGAQFDYFAHAVCGLARLTLGLLSEIGQAT